MQFDFIKHFQQEELRKQTPRKTRRKNSMTKGDALRLFNSLNGMVALKGAKFTYAVARNLATLKPEVEALAKVVEQSEEFKEFETKRIALAEKFSKKDKDNKPVVSNANYVIEDQATFDTEYKALREANKEILKKYEEQVKEYGELLKSDVSVNLIKVKLADVPADITAAQMNGILEMVEEE